MTADARLRAQVARYDALVTGGLALVLQGEDPAPLLGPGSPATDAAVLVPIWSAYAAAVTALDAAAGGDRRRARAALDALSARAAKLHALADQLLDEAPSAPI